MTKVAIVPAIDPVNEAAPHRARVSLPGEIVMIGSGVFGSLALSALSPVLPDIQATFATTPHIAFWTKAIVTIDGIAMIAAPFAGFAAQKFGGPRRLMILSYLLFLIAGLTGAAMPGLTGILITRFLVGIAGAMLMTMAITLIGDRYTGRARELRIGFNHATGATLIALMVMLSGWLGDSGGWRWAFAVHLIAIPFLICAIAAPELAQFSTVQHRGHAQREPLSRVLPVALIGLAGGSIALSVPIFLPFHLSEIGHDRALLAGTMFTLLAGVSVASSLTFGLLRQRIGGPGVFAIAFSLWAVGLATAGLGPNLATVAVGVILVGMGGGLVQPSIFSLLARTSDPRSLARNNGLVKGCFYGGPFIGTSLLHLLLGQYPAGVSLLALGAFAVLLLAIAVPVAARAER